MKKMKKYADIFLVWACIILMCAMTITVTYQVITRRFLHSPSVVSESLSKYMFLWMVLLCAAYVFGLREHMNIGFIKDKCPKRIKFVLDMIGEIVIMLFGVSVMTIGGYFGAIRQINQMDSALPISMSIIYAIVPISGLFMIFYFFNNCSTLIEEYKNTNKKEEK